MPGLDEVSGRERLAFYRSKDQAWWDQLAAVYPNSAWQHALDFIQLSRRYGPPRMVALS
jgi:hypothetical protein